MPNCKVCLKQSYRTHTQPYLLHNYVCVCSMESNCYKDNDLYQIIISAIVFIIVINCYYLLTDNPLSLRHVAGAGSGHVIDQ